MLERLKEEVIYYGLKMSRSGLAPASWGNISARDPDSGHIVITPSGIDYERLSVGDIVVLDSVGKVLEGEKIASSETPFHRHIYQHRTGINGIVHTHSVYATALATLKQKIPVILGNLVTAAGGEIDVVSYTPAGSEELGPAILERIGNVAAVVIQNHGVVAIGPNLWKAFQAAAVVEDAAKIYTICRLLGEPSTVSVEEVARIRKSKFVAGFPLD